MPGVTKLGHGQITLDEVPIITFTTWDEDLKGNPKKLAMVGMRGIADGPADGTITVESGVPVGGEQFNYRRLVRKGTLVTMTVYETATGVEASYEGVISSYNRKEAVDGEPRSSFVFEGYPVED